MILPGFVTAETAGFEPVELKKKCRKNAEKTMDLEKRGVFRGIHSKDLYDFFCKTVEICFGFQQSLLGRIVLASTDIFGRGDVRQHF